MNSPNAFNEKFGATGKEGWTRRRAYPDAVNWGTMQIGTPMSFCETKLTYDQYVGIHTGERVIQTRAFTGFIEEVLVHITTAIQPPKDLRFHIEYMGTILEVRPLNSYDAPPFVGLVGEEYATAVVTPFTDETDDIDIEADLCQ